MSASTIFRYWTEIAIFVAIVAADAAGWIPLTQTIFLLPMIWLALRMRRELWAAIGFSLPKRLWHAIAIGTVAGIAMELLAVHATTPLIAGWFGDEPDYSEFNAIHGNLGALFAYIALSWGLAAFGEELCFRGFLMNRLARVFGGGRIAWGASLLASSVLFGWGHTEQGLAGWIQEGFSGFLLGVLFLLGGRNLAIPIVAHGVSNTLAFVLIYLGRYPGIS